MENELDKIRELSLRINSALLEYIKEQGDTFDTLDSEIKDVIFQTANKLLKDEILAKG